MKKWITSPSNIEKIQIWREKGKPIVGYTLIENETKYSKNLFPCHSLIFFFFFRFD